MSDFAVEVKEDAIQLIGEVAYPADVGTTLERTLAQIEADTLKVDMAQVTFMDTTGAGVLIAVNKALREERRSLRLVNVPERVRQRLEVLGVRHAFEVE